MARDVDEAGVHRHRPPDPDRPRREVSDHAHLRGEAASLAYVKEGRRRRRTRPERGITFTVSFTVTKELDQLIHDLAIDAGVSRSSVVRSAVLRYGRAKGFVA